MCRSLEHCILRSETLIFSFSPRAAWFFCCLSGDAPITNYSRWHRSLRNADSELQEVRQLHSLQSARQTLNLLRHRVRHKRIQSARNAKKSSVSSVKLNNPKRVARSIALLGGKKPTYSEKSDSRTFLFGQTRRGIRTRRNILCCSRFCRFF